MISRHTKQQVFVLSSAQALFQTVTIMIMTIGGLAGASVSSDPRLATVPVASMFLGTALILFPASIWMSKVGRHIGFLAGTGLGVLGGLVAALGIFWHNLWILALGTFFIGGYRAFAQFYRFAASEVATLEFRPRAISLVTAGGVVAALLGPTLASFGGHLFSKDFLGSFLILAIMSALATAVLAFLKMPKTQAATTSTVQNGSVRPWYQIVKQPAYLVAMFGAATGYGLMLLAMSAAPIAMKHHHHELGTISTIIQLHVLGMFAPSFFTGNLIDRFGKVKVMAAGYFCFIAFVLVSLTGYGVSSFAVALLLLGLGWNFLYVGGTALVTETYTDAERTSAQAINDMAIFIVSLIGSLGAGYLVSTLGWKTMNLLLLVWLVVGCVSLLWLVVYRKKQATIKTAPVEAIEQENLAHN